MIFDVFIQSLQFLLLPLPVVPAVTAAGGSFLELEKDSFNGDDLIMVDDSGGRV